MDEARAERLRLAEPLAALSLAIDLGLGQPMAHGLRTCLIALELGRALRLSERRLFAQFVGTEEPPVEAVLPPGDKPTVTAYLDK